MLNNSIEEDNFNSRAEAEKRFVLLLFNRHLPRSYCYLKLVLLQELKGYGTSLRLNGMIEAKARVGNLSH
jgi:hypothetical protein